MAGLVTVHVWRVPPRQVPAAFVAVARDRGRMRREAGAQFAKLLGTSRGFSVRDSDPSRWALVTAWTSRPAAEAFESSPTAEAWAARATETWRLVLRPIASRGRWSGVQPFDATGEPWDGPVVAITRARLAPRGIVSFWRAVPPVAGEARRSQGLLMSMGVGEAPLGYQGTLSVWSDAGAARSFAYAGIAHREAITRSRGAGWYAEELFARFAVLDSCGTIDGCDPLTRGQ